jgi:hypothetical protein
MAVPFLHKGSIFLGKPRQMQRSINHQRLLFSLFFYFFVGTTPALEFMPYPVAKITHEQWQSFYEKARTSLGHSQRTYNDRNIVVFIDSFNGHHYAFTLPGHAAHPSWIVRRIVNHEGELHIQQVGYYVEDEAEFVELFKAYLELNEQIKPNLQDRNTEGDQ